MQYKASLRDRLLVGTGIIFSICIVALPAVVQRDSARTQRPHGFVPEDPNQWFGLSSHFDLRGLAPEGSDWRTVGPLQFQERDNGEARLTGFLLESTEEEALLQVDLVFSERREGTESESQPASYGKVTGLLRGLGSLSGGLLRVESGRDSALQCTARHGEVAFRTEWLQRPTADSTQANGRKGTHRFSMDFTHEAVWGASELQFDFGGLEAEFELLAGGHFVERADGSAWLSAVVAERGFRGHAFHMELSASRSQSWSMVPIEDFTANPLVGPTGLSGGMAVVDPASWRTYDQFEGSMRGIDQFEGALIELRSSNNSLRVGVGVGVDEEQKRQGVFAEFITNVVRPTDAGGFGLERGKCRSGLEMTLVGSNVQFAFEATADGNLPRGQHTFAADLGTLGDDFVFEAGGCFSSRENGAVHFSGQIVRASDKSCAYFLDMELDDLRPGFGSHSTRLDNWTGLESWAFSTNGGPINPAFWHNYESFEGRLIGLRDCSGSDYVLSNRGLPFQIGFGANGRSFTEGAYGTFDLHSTEPGSEEPQRGLLSVDLQNSSEQTTFVTEGGFWIDQVGADFIFTSGGRMRQTADGIACISGIVTREHFQTHRFFVDMRLSDRIDPTQVEGDQPAWTQFETVEGQLVGLDDLAGARLEVRSTGGVASLGLGAHGDSTTMGAQIPFDLHVSSQPSGEVRLRTTDSRAGLGMALSRKLELGAEEALASSFMHLPGGHALYLPGIAEDFILPSSGRFQEFADGTATFEGRMISLTDSDLGFDVQIDFSGRFADATMARLEMTLPSSAYIEREGPVDTNLWHFYHRSRGILVGTQGLAGAVLRVGHEGTSMQVGLGANGRNLEHGASANLTVELLSQPVGGGLILPEAYPGAELHIDLPALAVDSSRPVVR